MKSTAPRQAMPKEVEALRASLDTRLTALEKALADPKQHGSLEALILDLARIATEEADATARNAVLDAQKKGQIAAAAARTDAVEALEAEKVESAALRQVIEQAKLALKQAETSLKEERRNSEEANREVAGAHRELAAMRETIEQQQSASTAQRHELEAARAAVDSERARASTVEQQIAQGLAQAESERAALASELDQHRTTLEAERASAAELLQRSAELEADLAAVRHELNASRSELNTTRRDLDNMRQDADARTQTLSHSQGEQEQALAAARDAARNVAARLELEIHERDALQQESTELKRQLEAAEGAIRERDAVVRQMQAAHEARDAAEVLEAARQDHGGASLEPDAETVVDLTSITEDEERFLAIERRTRSLELALRDAEMRAESAELELDRHRARGTPAPDIRPSSPSIHPPSAKAATGSDDQFRGPARGAKRVAFKSEPDIQVDGSSGKLVDLSLTGAQVLTPSAVNPNRLISVTLTLADSPIVCKAKVMWSRLEPRSGQLWYRAGVNFTSVDQLALEAFLADPQS